MLKKIEMNGTHAITRKDKYNTSAHIRSMEWEPAAAMVLSKSDSLVRSLTAIFKLWHALSRRDCPLSDKAAV
jgi:hypothetical protein